MAAAEAAAEALARRRQLGLPPAAAPAAAPEAAPEAADEEAAARVAAAAAMAAEDEAAEEGAAAAARPLDSFARALLEAVVHSPRWLPDAEVRACQTCAATFGNVTQRRHHCRHCGRVLCSSCSRDRCAIPKFGISRLVRVCGDCSIVLASAAAAAAEDNAEQTMRELRTGQPDQVAKIFGRMGSSLSGGGWVSARDNVTPSSSTSSVNNPG